MTSSHLPFELSEQSIADWLLTLSKLNSMSSANELNKVIQKIRQMKGQPKEVLQTLIQLMPTILIIDKSVESSLLSEENSKNGKIPRKIEKLTIQLLRNLSLAFSSLSDEDSLTLEEKTQAIYFSLQLIGYTQRVTIVFHEFPSSTLWKKTAALYILAKKVGVDQQEVKVKIKVFKHLPSIESVLKRNLLFSLLSPYRFSCGLIQELFSICDKQAHLLTLNLENQDETCFLWDLDNGHAPTLHNSKNITGKSILVINISLFLSYIQSSNLVSDQINGQTLSQVIHELSGYKQIMNSSLPTELTISNLIEGHSEIIDYLNNVDRLNKIQQFSSELTKNRVASKLSLEPMDFEKSHLKPDDDLMPGINIVEVENAQTVKVLQTKNKDYIVAISNLSQYSIGNLVFLYSLNAEPELGIIRLIYFFSDSNTTKLLIERVNGKFSAEKFSFATSHSEKIILVHKKNSSTEFFIAPSKIPNGSILDLANQQTLKIDKMIGNSPFFMHYVT